MLNSAIWGYAAGRSLDLFLRAAHEERWCWKHCYVLPCQKYVNTRYSHLILVHFNFLIFLTWTWIIPHSPPFQIKFSAVPLGERVMSTSCRSLAFQKRFDILIWKSIAYKFRFREDLAFIWSNTHIKGHRFLQSAQHQAKFDNRWLQFVHYWDCGSWWRACQTLPYPSTCFI